MGEPDGRPAVGMAPGGSLAKLLAWRVAEQPEQPMLLVEDEGPWTVGRLASTAARVADELTRSGVGAGDRVLVRVGNDERFLPALVGTWLARAAAIAVHPATPAGDLDRVAADLGAAAVVAPPDDDTAADLDVPLVTMPRVDVSGPVLTTLAVPERNDDDEAVVLLTSGSTGAPKGVVLTHGAAWSNLRATASAFRRDDGPTPWPVDPKPPNLVANPFSHTGGLVRLLFALYVGRRLVVLRKFDAARTKAAVDAHGIDHLTLNPTMLRMLLDAVPEGEGLGAVRYVSSGTAPLTPTLREAFEARFGVPVLQAYGQTEAFGGIAIESVRDVLAGRRRADSVGKPLPGVEVRIAGRDGSAVASGSEGEILVRSQASTAGYASAGVASSPVDAGGWLHTGDLGRLDADGYLYVTGRSKSLIICGGFNIVPEELEARLEADPSVREATVVAVADERLGEIPVALVEAPDEPADGAGAAILDRVARELVAYKRPRRLFVVPALPRLASGKVDKPAARALAERLLR